MCVQSPTPPTIRWYRRNFELHKSEKIRIQNENKNHSKLIYDEPLEGVYKAVVTNEYGIATYEVQVLVEFLKQKEKQQDQQQKLQQRRRSSVAATTIENEAPAFLQKRRLSASSSEQPQFKLEKRGSIPNNDGLPKPPKFQPPFFKPIMHLNFGDILILECKVDAIPEAEFCWLQNNFEIKNNPSKTIRIDSKANCSKAYIEKPVDGRYEVVATNSMGKDSATTKVIINYESQKNIKEISDEKQIVAESKFAKEEKQIEKVAEDKQQISDFAEPKVAKQEVVTEIKEESQKAVKKQLTKETAEKIANEMLSDQQLEEVIKKSINAKPPQFVKSLNKLLMEQELSVGAQLFVEVEIAKDKEEQPTCMFQWFINNCLIPPQYIENREHSTILNIPEIKKDMEGTLIVAVTNLYGSDYSSINLFIKSGNTFLRNNY